MAFRDPVDKGDLEARFSAIETDVDVLQGDVSRRIVSFYGPSTAPPTAEGIGDIWYVSDMGNLTRRWNGSAWVDINYFDDAITRITASLVRTASSQNRVELGVNPGAPTTTYASDVRFYWGTEAIGTPGGRISGHFSTNQIDYIVKTGGAGLHKFTGDAWFTAGFTSDGFSSMFAGGLLAGAWTWGNGNTIRHFDRGKTIDNTDANSRISITHGLGVTPDVVVLTNSVGEGTTGQVQLFSRGTTNFTVECRVNGGALAGGGVTRAIHWLAVAF